MESFQGIPPEEFYLESVSPTNLGSHSGLRGTDYTLSLHQNLVVCMYAECKSYGVQKICTKVLDSCWCLAVCGRVILLTWNSWLCMKL